jgi:hypothetical protein
VIRKGTTKVSLGSELEVLAGFSLEEVTFVDEDADFVDPVGGFEGELDETGVI